MALVNSDRTNNLEKAIIMRKSIKATIAGTIAATAIVGTIAAASPAEASYWRYATTTVQWGGSSCINVQAANEYGLRTLCGYGNSWDLDERPYVGQGFGMDPIMGNASWVACYVYLDGQLVYSDSAYAGDGHDANCNRSLNY